MCRSARFPCFCVYMKRAVALFVFVLALGIYVPLGAHADEGETAFTSFTLNGAEADAEISSDTPEVEISVSAPEEVRFTRLYICPEASDPCDGSSAIKFFSPNATTTSFTREWDGTTTSDEAAPPGVYHITARFFRYDIQPDAFEETAPYTITVLGEDEEEEGENDEEDDGDEGNAADNQTPALSTLRWTPFTEDSETGEREYGEEVIFSDGAEEAVPFSTPGEISIETDFPVFGLEATLFYIPDPDSPTREFVASFGGFPNGSGGFSFPFDELAWSTPGVYELDLYEIETPVLVQAPLWRQMLGWFIGSEAHAAEHATLIDRIRFTVLEEIELPPEPEYAECCSSVVFLPGLKGSVLKSGDDTVWPADFGSSFAFSNDIQQLAIDPETGGSVNLVTVDGILNSFDVKIHGIGVSTPIYEGFSSFMNSLTAIDSETGTSTIKAWEPLAYDWRFSPEKVIVDENMITRLEELASDSDTGQVTIVAHSMGGLVGKELIRQLEEQGKEELIDSFVMIGAPQLGTPQAIASLLHGDDEGILGGLIVSASDVREVAQNMPSAYNLLPSSRYFDIVSDAPILFNENAGFTEEWREYWGSSSLGRYLDFFSFATGGGVARTKPSSLFLKIPEVLNPDLMTEAQALHSELDSYDFPESIRVVQVAGWGVPTTKAIEYKEKHLLSQSYQLVPTREGDKTVVYPSAISSAALNFFFNLDSFNKLPNIPDFQHRDLLSAPPVQTLFQSVIKEMPIEETAFITTIKPSVTDLDDQIMVRTNSPVILGVYDEFGNFTGIDQSQDLNAPVFLIVENIPGSYFLISGDSQSIFLPIGGTYTFVYQGTDDGDTTVEIGSFSNDQELISHTFTDIATTASTTATFLIAPESEDITLELDEDGDGTADTTILSDEKTLELQAEEDQETPPVETASPPAPSGGGGPLWNSPAPSTAPEQIVPPVPTPNVAIESTPTVVPTQSTPPPPIESFSPPVLEPIVTTIQSPQPETGITELLNASPTNLSNEPGQTATAIQSGWYDWIVQTMQKSLTSFMTFLRGLF